MFKIDLLKGQGIPIKSRPEGIAIVAATFATPVIVAIVMFGVYLSNSIAMSVQKQEIVRCEKEIDKLSDAVNLQKAFEKEKDIINTSLSEVKSSIGRCVQWSGILVTLAKNVPDSVLLTRLETKQNSVRKKVARKDDPGKTTDTTVPVRILQMTVNGRQNSDSDKSVREFRDKLRFSDLLKSRLDDIRVSQGFDNRGDQDVLTYDIDCVFKPEL